jgi:competence protein ComEC
LTDGLDPCHYSVFGIVISSNRSGDRCSNGKRSAITMPQSAIARRFLAQFSSARQADELITFISISAIENALEAQRDQLPLLVPVGLGAGIIGWQFGGEGELPAIFCAAAATGCFAAYLGIQYRVARTLLWAALLFCLGFLAISVKSSLVSGDALKRPTIITFNGYVESVEDVSARGLVRYVLKTGGHAELPKLVRVNVPKDKHRAEIEPGAIIQVKARLMPPAGPALPNSYDFSRQAWFLGIGATGSALSSPVLITQSPGSANFWSVSRESLAAHIRSAMPGESGAVGAALLVGTRGAISEPDAEALRNSGMAHLLSVSGLHVTAVVGGAFMLISRILALFPWLALRIRVPIAAAGGAAAIAVAYTLLTGAEVPTVRACIAALLILVALAMGREPLSLRLLAAGACLVLLFWPEALAGPSFQLSFAAVATIILLHDSRLMQRLTLRRDETLPLKLGRFVFSLLATGVAIELILAPIALFHFHKSGLYGALANIVAIPLTTFFVMPLQILALIFDQIGIGGPLWWLAGQGVAVIMMMAYGVSEAPGSVLMLPSMPVWAFGLTVIGGLWLAIVVGKARLAGLLPIALGMAAMATAPRPNLLVTGDGRHVAIVDEKGELVLLRPGAGDYAVSMLSENAAIKTEPKAIDEWDGAQCSADICSFAIKSDGRNWSIMATRSGYLVPAMEFAAACKRADIVISERYLPWSCKPRWFKADRDFLERHGGLAVYFDTAFVDSVARTTGHQPWSTLGKRERAPKRPFNQSDAKLERATKAAAPSVQ